MQALRHAQAADTHKNDGSSHQLFCPALPGQKTSLPALVGLVRNSANSPITSPASASFFYYVPHIYPAVLKASRLVCRQQSSSELNVALLYSFRATCVTETGPHTNDLEQIMNHKVVMGFFSHSNALYGHAHYRNKQPVHFVSKSSWKRSGPHEITAYLVLTESKAWDKEHN